ncbi:MAG: hypothetical protein ACYCZH_14000 [Sulfuriferula sp.]
MIGSRSRYSLAQFLELQETSFVIVLLSKHSARISVENGQLLMALVNNLRSQADETVLSVLDEITRTNGDLRARVNPKYRYDERLADLSRCLQLDGYLISDKQLIQTDPSISDAPPLDDDLTQELQTSGLPKATEVIRKINDSSESFRASTPNYNACLNDIRVALETLAGSIAHARKSASSSTYDPAKWGSIIGFLKAIGFVTQEEERGLAGVYGFVSPGSHRPLGLSEEKMARLGRSLALGMCWFLIKSHKAAE